MIFWNIQFYGFTACIALYHHYYSQGTGHTGHLHHPKISFVLLPFSHTLAHIQSLATTDLFSASIVWPFLECYVDGIHTKCHLWDFLSLINMPLKFFQCIVCISSVFLFIYLLWMINMPLCGYANSLLSLYHEGHLGCYQLSGIMNRTAMNIIRRSIVQCEWQALG